MEKQSCCERYKMGVSLRISEDGSRILVDNPAVQFKRDVKNHKYDDVDDDMFYEQLEHFKVCSRQFFENAESIPFRQFFFRCCLQNLQDFHEEFSIESLAECVELEVKFWLKSDVLLWYFAGIQL